MLLARAPQFALGGFVLAAVLFPLVVGNPFYISIAITAYVTAIAVYGMDIMLGRTGQLSLAQGGFFGVGGYATGILMTRYDLNFWLALPAAIALTCILGYLVGMAALRTRESYFAIFTLAVGAMITIVIQRWEGMTGGTDGLIGIPPPSPIGPLRFDGIVAQYYLILAFLLLTLYLVWSLVHSLVGRTFFAVRSSEELARSVGIDVGRTQRLAFTLSVAFAGLGGGLYAVFLGYIGPAMSAVLMSFLMLVYLMLGGVATLAGPLLGTVLVIGTMQGLHAFQEHQLMFLGPIVILVMIFIPKGLAGLVAEWYHRARARQVAASAAARMGSGGPQAAGEG